jgi:hypothetical protein
VIRRGLVANGDPRDIATFSNIPLFALRPLTLDRPRGWTYSRRYARTVWARREVAGEMEEYISRFQLFPPRDEVAEPITHYIDPTLRQWFEDYGWRVGRRVRSDALARERQGYLTTPSP